MSATTITRRDLVQAAGAALVTVALPAGLAATPPGFDVAGFLADLRATGYRLAICWPIPRGGETAEPPHYVIRPPEGRGFGQPYAEVMARWADAMAAHPDHVERVTAHLLRLNGWER